MKSQLRIENIAVNGVKGPVIIGGDAPADEAVVFVHGNPGAGSDWEPVLSQVSQFANVVVPDMPGFGGADKRAYQHYTVSDYASYLGGVVDQLGLERVHLVAHDFGGPFALTWAAQHPDRVASITLINTGVLINYRWHRLARLWRTPVLGEIAQKATTPAMARWLIRHDNPGLPDSAAAQIAAHLMPPQTKSAVLQLYRSTNRRDIEALADHLRRRDPETLVIWGDRDNYLPVVQAEQQRSVFPHCRVEILPGVGHWAWLEQPDRVAELVIPFLRAQINIPSNPNSQPAEG